MRVVVTGATGNIGTGVLAALQRDPAVEEIVGVARRRPQTNLGLTKVNGPLSTSRATTWRRHSRGHRS